jgi:hypothetical protein
MIDAESWRHTAPKRLEVLMALTRLPQTSRDLQALGISSGDVNYYVGRVDPDKRAEADAKARRGVEGYLYVSLIGEGFVEIVHSSRPATFRLTPKGLELQQAVHSLINGPHS